VKGREGEGKGKARVRQGEGEGEGERKGKEKGKGKGKGKGTGVKKEGRQPVSLHWQPFLALWPQWFKTLFFAGLSIVPVRMQQRTVFSEG